MSIEYCWNFRMLAPLNYTKFIRQLSLFTANPLLRPSLHLLDYAGGAGWRRLN